MERNRAIGIVCVILQIVNATFAFTTSELQTKRIMKEISKFNTPSLAIMSGGLIAAVIGTVVIMSKIVKGTRQVEENNNILKRSIR